jgi:diaminohydroxyphosphoribosylaminopyrimidine deaminase / 5-amino-6-(5-phosphoribosylamino)uracil reductase
VNDTAHMAHALTLAARGLGRTWPNPAVGCVIVKGGPGGDRVVGRGWTQPGGRPHAETMALAQAAGQARGATAYVTLEPCAHHGKTPPCAQALIAAGVARVVTAMTDPDPRVAGKGHADLRAAGIAVTEGVLSAAAARLNAGFVKRITGSLPFVTLKLATTLDGRIATATGESRWITGPEARRKVHAMRMQHDAVLVGSGTARADDPDLGVRNMGPIAQPLRIVLDSALSHDPASRLGRGAGQSPVWMLCTDRASPERRQVWQDTGAQVIEVAAKDGRVDPQAAMTALGQRGLTRILCEGGARLGASLLHAGLVDDLAMFTSGLVMGADGHAALGPLGLQRLDDAPRAKLIESRTFGGDSFTLWSFPPASVLRSPSED